jgi:hypothetical protein
LEMETRVETRIGGVNHEDSGDENTREQNLFRSFLCDPNTGMKVNPEMASEIQRYSQSISRRHHPRPSRINQGVMHTQVSESEESSLPSYPSDID